MNKQDILNLLPAKKEVPKPYKTHTGHISDSDMVFALGYNLYRDEAISALSKITDKPMDYTEILKLEGLSDWTFKITSGGGLCLYDKKELWLTPDNPALFLHEVAHALCTKEKCGICWVETNNGHNAIWGDTFTSLVKKYMVGKIPKPEGKEEPEVEIKRAMMLGSKESEYRVALEKIVKTLEYFSHTSECTSKTALDIASKALKVTKE